MCSPFQIVFSCLCLNPGPFFFSGVLEFILECSRLSGKLRVALWYEYSTATKGYHYTFNRPMPKIGEDATEVVIFFVAIGWARGLEPLHFCESGAESLHFL